MKPINAAEDTVGLSPEKLLTTTWVVRRRRQSPGGGAALLARPTAKKGAGSWTRLTTPSRLI